MLSAPLQETVAQLAGFENIFDATVEAVHEDRGTMQRVRIACANLATELVPLETPLIRARAGSQLRVGIRAGDILLAIVKARGTERP